ncbi:MAG TPA: cytochrome C biogenesis protein [Allosphingosinicella sp.]|nr:cytochrome C biogenesis protein [Allosphingosinicella sp.]
MGWLAIIGLALGVGAALWRFGGLRGPLLQLLAAAVLIAMAGYAWQGRPGLPGSPKRMEERAEQPDTPFATLRSHFLERFDRASSWLIMADSYQRRGDTQGAVGIIRAGLKSSPNNMSLWTGLGHALVQHGGGTMNPAAELAYKRALALGQGHPGPAFFYGLGLIQSGRIEEGEQVWRRLLAAAPEGAGWRPVVEERLAVIDQLRAMGRLPQPGEQARP